MCSKKSQASMEYVIIIAMLMLAFGYISYFTLSDLQVSMELANAQDVVDSLAKAANTVYSLGPCSKTYVFVTIPNSVVDSYVKQNTIGLEMSIMGGNTDIYAHTLGNVTGYLPATPRSYYKIPVEMTCSGVLIIGGGFSITSREIRLNITQGESGSINLNLTNERGTIIGGMDSFVIGGASNWITISGLATSIDPGITDEFTASFNIPSETRTGTYAGTLMINGTDAFIEVPIYIVVDEAI